MASIIPKPNGTYLIRVSCGCDDTGRGITRSKIFRPSRENLSYQKLNREMEVFIKEFEEELERIGADNNPDRISFAGFCEKFLEIKSTSLSPKTIPFYEKIIREQLIPMYGKIRIRDIRPITFSSTFNISVLKRSVRTARKDISPPPRSNDTQLYSALSCHWHIRWAT